MKTNSNKLFTCLIAIIFIQVKDQEKDKLTILRKLVSDTSDMTKMKEKMKV